MVSTLTAGATAYFHWNSNFSDRYHVTPEIEKKLNDSNSAKEMSQFTEHDGIRIEAVQSVADSSTAHIILKIQGSEELPFNGYNGFGSMDIEVEGNDQISWFGSFLNEEVDEQATGAEYEIMIQDVGELGLLNKPIKLTFHNIVDVYEGKKNMTDYPVLLEATWELTLNLDNEGAERIYEVNQQIPGSEAVVKKIRLSSVSFTLDMDWKYQIEVLPYTDENGAAGTFEHVVNPPRIYGIVYEDGTVREGVLSEFNSSFTNDEKTECRRWGYNNEMIDYENVSELIFFTDAGQVRVPVEK